MFGRLSQKRAEAVSRPRVPQTNGSREETPSVLAFPTRKEVCQKAWADAGARRGWVFAVFLRILLFFGVLDSQYNKAIDPKTGMTYYVNRVTLQVPLLFPTVFGDASSISQLVPFIV